MDKKKLIAGIIAILFTMVLLVMPVFAAPTQTSIKMDILPTPTGTRHPRPDSWNHISYYQALPASIYSVIPGCNNSSTLFATTDVGLYYSHDGGNTWDILVNEQAEQPVSTAMPVTQTAVPQITPTSTAVPQKEIPYLYWRGYTVSCMEGKEFLYIGTQNGILRVDMASQEFELLQHNNGLPGLANIRVIEFSGKYPSVGFASVWGEGIYRTEDWGNTWSLVSNEDQIYTSSITISQADTDIIFAVTTANKLYTSRDHGKSWEVKNILGIPPAARIVSLLNNQNDLNSLLAWVGVVKVNNKENIWDIFSSAPGTTFQSIGIYKSTDGGSSWFPAFIGIDHPEMIQELVAPIYSSGSIYASTDQVGGYYQSTDFGESWKLHSPWMLATKSISAINENAGELLAGTRFGEVYASKDGGETWFAKFASVPDNLSVFQISTSFNEQPLVYLGTSNGVYSISLDGENKIWHSLNNGISTSQITCLTINPKNGNELYVGSASGEIFVTRNGGQSWRLDRKPEETTNINALYFDKDSNVYAGTSDGVLLKKSADQTTWDSLDIPVRMPLHRIAQNQGNGWLFVAADAAGLFISKDQGQNWEVINNLGPLSNEMMFVQDVAVDVKKLGRIYITLKSGKLYRSDDNGQTWQYFTSPQFGQEAIVQIISNSPKILVLTHQNVFLSNNDGKNWRSIVYGVPSTAQFSTIQTDLDKTDNFLVGTLGQGLFSGDIDAIMGDGSVPTNYLIKVANIFDTSLTTMLIAAAIGTVFAVYIFRKWLKFPFFAVLSPVNILWKPARVPIQASLIFFLAGTVILDKLFKSINYQLPYTHPLLFFGYRYFPQIPGLLNYNIYSPYWINSIFAFAIMIVLAVGYTLSSYIATSRAKAASFSSSLSFFAIYYPISMVGMILLLESLPPEFPSSSYNNTIVTYSIVILACIYMLGFRFAKQDCGSLRAWAYFPVAPLYASVHWARPLFKFFMELPWRDARQYLYNSLFHPRVLIQDLERNPLKTYGRIWFYIFVFLFSILLDIGMNILLWVFFSSPIDVLTLLGDWMIFPFDALAFAFCIEFIFQLANHFQPFPKQQNPANVTRYRILIQAFVLVLIAVYLARTILLLLGMSILSLILTSGSPSKVTIDSVSTLLHEGTVFIKLFYTTLFIWIVSPFKLIRNIDFNSIHFREHIRSYFEILIDLLLSGKRSKYSKGKESFTRLSISFLLLIIFWIVLTRGQSVFVPTEIAKSIRIWSYLLFAIFAYSFVIYVGLHPRYPYYSIINPILRFLIGLLTYACLSVILYRFINWLVQIDPFAFTLLAMVVAFGIIGLLTDKVPFISALNGVWSFYLTFFAVLFFTPFVFGIIFFCNIFSHRKKQIFILVDTILSIMSTSYLFEKARLTKKAYGDIIVFAKDSISQILDNPQTESERTMLDSLDFFTKGLLNLLGDKLTQAWTNISKVNLDLALQLIAEDLNINPSEQYLQLELEHGVTREQVYNKAGIKALSIIMARDPSLIFKNIASVLQISTSSLLFQELSYETKNRTIARILGSFSELLGYNAQKDKY